jgi:predicted site-specific integrase-resolvase
MKKGKFMNAKKFAEAMEVEYATVIRWLKAGLVPGAELREVMPGVKWWEIPYDALKMERPRAGRKRSPKEGATK